MRRIPRIILLPAWLAACSQAHVDAPATTPKAPTIQEKLDRQECEKSRRYHGHPALEPFHYFLDSEEKVNECLKRRGHAVPSE